MQQPLIKGHCVAGLKHVDDTRILIHQLKYANGLRAGRTLSQVLLDAVIRRYRLEPLPQCLIPVPLSWRNQTHRGYNQAAVLARPLAQALTLPIVTDVVRRRHGPAQHTLSQQQRQQRQSTTFVLHKPLPFEHIAIIDDVLTTGGTVKALSNLLYSAGAKRVDVWCASRAFMD